ncbi:molecular chaperone Hsp33 [bacterium]|nr:molecular chaperone Hsp33 [bacterium]
MVSNDNQPPPSVIGQDMILPFLIDKTHLHGRFVRLSEAVNDILHRHNYPLPVSHLLAEQLLITGLLSRSLKHDGIITIQVQGDGPVRLMVTDITADGTLRGYAELSEEGQKYFEENVSIKRAMKDVFGKGYLCITLDHLQGKQPYQGIVELSGDDLTDCCLRYMHQSDQFNVHIKTMIGHSTRYDDKARWRAAGIMVQRLPDEEHFKPEILPDPMEDGDSAISAEDDDWNRTIMFVDSLTEQEMLDPDMMPNTMLYRLFHEDGIWVYEETAISAGCRCNRERIENVLKTMDGSELEELAEEGSLKVTCQFCNTNHVFLLNELLGKA